MIIIVFFIILIVFLLLLVSNSLFLLFFFILRILMRLILIGFCTVFSSWNLLEIIFICSCSLIFFILKYNNNSVEQIIFYLSGFVFCFIRISPYFNILSNNYSKINLNYQSLESFLNSRKKFKEWPFFLFRFIKTNWFIYFFK